MPKRSRSGTTILGTVLAVAIFVIVVLAITAAAFYYLRYSGGVREATEAASEKGKEKLAVYLLPDGKSLLIKNVGQTQGPSRVVAVMVMECQGGPVIYTQQVETDIQPLGSITVVLSDFEVAGQNVVAVVTGYGNLFYATPSDMLVFDASGLPKTDDVVLTLVFNDLPNNNRTYAAKDLPAILSPYEANSFTFTWATSLVCDATTYAYMGTVGLITLPSSENTGRITSDGAHGIVKAIYSQEWQVTFRAEGVPATTDGPILTVMGEGYRAQDLPKAFTWYSGNYYSFEWVGSFVQDVKYLWVRTSGLSTARTGAISPTANGEVVGYYAPAFNVTFNVSNLEELPSAPVLWVDDQCYWRDAFPVMMELAGGVRHTYSWISLIDINSTHAMIWESSTGLPDRSGWFVANSNLEVVASYAQAVRITFSIGGLEGDVEGEVPALVVNSEAYKVSQLPLTTVFKLGSEVSYEWLTPLPSTNHLKQYRWRSCGGLVDGRSGTFTASEPGDVAGFYTPHFLPFAELHATRTDINVSDAQNARHPYSLVDNAVTAELVCTAINGTPPYSYQWYVDDAEAGADTPYFAFASNSSGVHSIKCRVKDSENYSYTTDALTITVHDAPLMAAVFFPPGQFYTSGSNRLLWYNNTEMQIICVASGGTPPYSYEWIVNGTVAGQGFQYAFSEPSEGVYEVLCRVTDGAGGVVNSAAFYIDVRVSRYLLVGSDAAGKAKLVNLSSGEAMDALVSGEAVLARLAGQKLIIASQQPPVVKAVDIFSGESSVLYFDSSFTLVNLLVQQDRLVAVLYDSAQHAVVLERLTPDLQANAFYTATRVTEPPTAFAGYSNVYLLVCRYGEFEMVSVDESGNGVRFPYSLAFFDGVTTAEATYFTGFSLHHIDPLTFNLLNASFLGFGLPTYKIAYYDGFLYLTAPISSGCSLLKVMPSTLNVESRANLTNAFITSLRPLGDVLYALVWSTASSELYLTAFNVTDLTAVAQIPLPAQPPTDNLLVLPNFPLSQLTITATGGGTTDPSPGNYSCIRGAPVSVTARPVQPYYFDHWEVNGSWAGNETTLQLTTDQAYNVTAVFGAQVQFEVSGLVGDAYGVVLIVDGNAYNLTDLPKAFRWPVGSTHTYSYSQIIPSAVNGKRYVLSNVTGPASPIIVSSAENVTGNYVVQWNVTFTQTGLDETATGVVLTVNGVDYTRSDLPCSIWVDEGSILTYAYVSPVSSSEDGKRFILTKVEGVPSPVNVTSAIAIVGEYEVEYLLAISSSDPSRGTTDPEPGEYWYRPGESVAVNAIAMPGYVFNYWLLDGVQYMDNPITVLMDASHELTAYFKEG